MIFQFAAKPITAIWVIRGAPLMTTFSLKNTN